jgi:hypothetical protein
MVDALHAYETYINFLSDVALWVIMHSLVWKHDIRMYKILNTKFSVHKITSISTERTYENV